MHNIKTQAILITENTYPIAVACLAAGFATIPVQNVYGSVLIINQPETLMLQGERHPRFTISNSWMDLGLFNRTHEIIDPGYQEVQSTTFVDVYRIAN